MARAVLERFLELTRQAELWGRVPLVYRSLIVTIARRDPARAVKTLDALAELWRRAREDLDA